ncbi:HAD family hydrolase [uncultured Faecalibaculum sp.]|uniref:HAD family hydrolase n=1 Tax=uncultured Faecalibaculum sp. TaxID=1729681 RepID=UPI0025D6CD24|nr:HAD family hydrolase [uncultured Faecalibaculum sp.]
MRKWKALFADIDGTLADKGENLMPETRKQLMRLHEAGVKIGLATGRPMDPRILDKARQWDLPFEFDMVIGLNGGELWTRDSGETLKMHPLSTESVHKVMDILEGEDVNAIIFRKGYEDVLCTRIDEFIEGSMLRNCSHVRKVTRAVMEEEPAGKVEVQYPAHLQDHVMQLLADHPDPAWITVATFPGAVEFMDPRVTKGNALELYARNQGIDPADILAFGDMDNDISMLQAAGRGICLKNGSAPTKAAADAVTEFSVLEDGVGRYLRDHISDAEIA